jgi:WD40 repeat protein
MMDSAAFSIECSDQPLDLSFHPTRPFLVAAGLVDGTVEIHDFQELVENEKKANSDDIDEDIDTILSSTQVHNQLLPSKATGSGSQSAKCRAVIFAENGNTLYSGGTAGDLARLDTEIVCSFNESSPPKSVLWRVPDASCSKSAIHVLHEIPPANGLIVTGDDVGGVRVWDPRLISGNQTKTALGRKPNGCVFSWKEHEDYISCLEHSSDGMMLLATSADCTMSVYDLRMAYDSQQKHVDKEKIVRRSDDLEDELLSMKVLKNGRKVVCGTGEGILSIFSWGTWGDISDRFPGHPASLDALVKVDEDTLLTGSSDGLIRLVSIQPDKLLGVLGNHQGFPIEKLEFSSDRSFVGSLTHDNIIRLWDARILQEDYEDEAVQMKAVESIKAASATISAEKNSDNEWEDMDEDDCEDMDDSDDSDDDTSGRNGKNAKRSGRFKSDNEKFFEDL